MTASEEREHRATLEVLEKRIRDDLRELAAYEEISVLERCQKLAEVKAIVVQHMWGQRSMIPLEELNKLSTDELMQLWGELSRVEIIQYMRMRNHER